MEKTKRKISFESNICRYRMLVIENDETKKRKEIFFFLEQKFKKPKFQEAMKNEEVPPLLLIYSSEVSVSQLASTTVFLKKHLHL